MRWPQAALLPAVAVAVTLSPAPRDGGGGLLCSRPDHVFVHHFPKTAGSSLREDVMTIARSLNVSMQFAYHDEIETPAFNASKPLAPFVMGHELTLDFHHRFAPAGRSHVYVSTFREPLSWWLSAFFQAHTPFLKHFRGDHPTADALLTWMRDQLGDCPRLLGSHNSARNRSADTAEAPCADRYGNWYVLHWTHFLPSPSAPVDACDVGRITTHMRELGTIVLLTAKYDESLRRLYAAFGLTYSAAPRVNQREHELYGRPMSFGGAKAAAELVSSTCMNEVYAVARSEFRRQGRMLEDGAGCVEPVANLRRFDDASKARWREQALPPAWSVEGAQQRASRAPFAPPAGQEVVPKDELPALDLDFVASLRAFGKLDARVARFDDEHGAWESGKLLKARQVPAPADGSARKYCLYKLKVANARDQYYRLRKVEYGPTGEWVALRRQTHAGRSLKDRRLGVATSSTE